MAEFKIESAPAYAFSAAPFGPATVDLFQRRTLLAFGDSITQQSFGNGGWCALLADWFSRKMDVINRGYSGYNTRHGVALVNEVIKQGRVGSYFPAKADVVLIFLGANDACLQDKAVQHVPLDEYQTNLTELIRLFRQIYPDTRIVLISPPPVDELVWARHVALKTVTMGLKKAQPEALAAVEQIKAAGHSLLSLSTVPVDTERHVNRTNYVTGLYAQAAKKVADAHVAAAKAEGEKQKVAFVDLWDGMQKEDDDWKSMLFDGLHLSARGNRYVFERVRDTMGNVYPTAVALSFDTPLWDMIDPEHPETSFQPTASESKSTSSL